MTSTMRTTGHALATADRRRMDSVRKAALWSGVLYVITFAASIPAKFFLNDPALAHADFMTRAGLDSALLWGGLLDLITALAGIGTAVAVYPVIRRCHEARAIGFVTTRLFEGAAILAGVLALVTIVSLRQGANADSASLVTTGNALSAIYDWSFLIGPGLMAAFNAMLFASLLFRFRLVPRVIPAIGLVGAPLLLASFVGLFFGLHEVSSPTNMIATAPIAVWELSVGFYMAIKGFKSSPASASTPTRRAASAPVPVA